MGPGRQVVRRVAVGSLAAAAALATVPDAGATLRKDCTEARSVVSVARCEAANLAMTSQGPAVDFGSPAEVAAATAAYQRDRRRALVADPERKPDPNSCTTVILCVIDPRMTDWRARGVRREPVLYTSRSGATISGHVWARDDDDRPRPGIVIVNGSIVGYEQAYWYLAQTLAQAGFLVMSFDVQGEGMSDQFGARPDQLENAFAGTPLLGLLGPRALRVDVFGGNGLPFYDGAQDAVDFLVSRPGDPYRPRASRTTSTDHGPKQARRVSLGRNSGHNPLWYLLDRDRVGLVGHSYGAQAASWLAQHDPRVDAAVALDSACVPPSRPVDEAASLSAPAPDFGGLPYVTYGFAPECFSTPDEPAPDLRTPVLGITGDYLLAPVPYLRRPHPLAKSRASLEYTAAGIDAGQIVIRGGTHLSFTDLPAPGSARAIDLTSWYTTAWMLRYLSRDPRGEAMLLSDRWRSDLITRDLDVRGDPNLFSWHLRSRLALTSLTGRQIRCEDLRAGCPALVGRANDGWDGDYSMIRGTGRDGRS